MGVGGLPDLSHAALSEESGVGEIYYVHKDHEGVPAIEFRERSASGRSRHSLMLAFYAGRWYLGDF